MANDEAWPARLVEAGDVELLVRDTGTGEPCLVLLHGLGGHSMEWWPVARVLAESYRVVAFDQRGHGGSTRQPRDVSRAAYVADVQAVLDHLQPTSVVLVGQSMGAHTALLAASALPERVDAVVLVEGGVGGGGAGPTDDVMGWFASWPSPFADTASAAAYFGGGETGRAWAAGLRTGPAGLEPQFDLDVLRTAIAAVHDEERWSEWAAIRRPVLIVKGGRGYLSPDEAQRMLFENDASRLVEVAGAGHDVHLDAVEPLARLVDEFVGESVTY